MAPARDFGPVGVVTHMTTPGEELISWHRERCGLSEAAPDEPRRRAAAALPTLIITRGACRGGANPATAGDRSQPRPELRVAPAHAPGGGGFWALRGADGPSILTGIIP